MNPVVLVHGGAAAVDPERITKKMNGVQVAAHEGYKILECGGTAVDAVEAAVRYMEDNEYFNAGFGSTLNEAGVVEMDASIMDGSNLQAGAVAVVKDIKNPISLARLVMDKSPYTLIAADGTTKLAEENDIPLVPPESLVSEYAKLLYNEFLENGGICAASDEKDGNVGAIACDKDGNVAAAISNGGLNGQIIGRIGDTPQIGSSIYADNDIGAVVCTGHGESILKYCLAHSIIKQMEKGSAADESTVYHVKKLSDRFNRAAGAISVSKEGEVCFYFTTNQMPWAYEQEDQIHFGIEHDEHVVMPASQLQEIKTNKKCKCCRKACKQ